MTRTIEAPVRATIVLPDAPERGPIVTPIDWSAGDRAIAQYFWTSTDKDSDAWTCPESEIRRVINFGMKAQPVPHGTPSGHGSLTVLVERIAMPTAEQMLRHRVQTQSPDGQACWVEWSPNISKKSHRYVTAGGHGDRIEDSFHVFRPEDLRSQVGRPGHYAYQTVNPDLAGMLAYRIEAAYERAWDTYLSLLRDGVCAEQARYVLPMGLLTRLYATASYRNWFNWLVQRNDGHAQEEIQQVARPAEQIVAQCCPITYELWLSHGRRVI